MPTDRPRARYCLRHQKGENSCGVKPQATQALDNGCSSSQHTMQLDETTQMRKSGPGAAHTTEAASHAPDSMVLCCRPWWTEAGPSGDPGENVPGPVEVEYSFHIVNAKIPSLRMEESTAWVREPSTNRATRRSAPLTVIAT